MKSPADKVDDPATYTIRLRLTRKRIMNALVLGPFQFNIVDKWMARSDRKGLSFANIIDI